MRRIVWTILAIAVLFTALDSSAHVRSILLPEGCGSCHVGHGIANEPMLAAVEEESCYQCHGSETNRSAMVSSGKLSPAATLDDMEQEFRKPYRHPAERSMAHSPIERLPLVSGAAANHAECVDCHNVHQSSQSIGVQGARVSGYTLSGQYVERATKDYETCLKCHGDNEGVRRSAKNVRQQFELSVRSMHPVTRSPRGVGQVSLLPSARTGRQMECIDCHNNDDPTGPKGPHGSNYEFLLNANYNRNSSVDESEFEYEFCYQCHDRQSILANESFSLHREHIVGDPLAGKPGTSCNTCHSAHSSQGNTRLVSFNDKVVDRSTVSRRLEYSSAGDNKGQCSLSCHNYSHEGARY